MKTLEDAPLAGKRVLVRIDSDVPLSGSDPATVADDYRLQKLLPTIFFLINHRAKIILCGHLGRPKAQTVPSLSLKPVFLHLSALINRRISFATNPIAPETLKKTETMAEGEILGLENIRFYKGEEDNSRTFARSLSKLADIYVNEAFGSPHTAASTVAITEFLPSYAGLRMEHEIEILTNLTKNPARPFIAIIGGAKTVDKLPALGRLLPATDRILVGGRVANTFLASQGFDVRRSTVEAKMVDEAGAMYKHAKGKIVLPTDYIWSGNQILDIGPKSTGVVLAQVKKARTILWSGVPGKVEEPQFSQSSKLIAQAIAGSPATSIIGGGDTVGFINNLGLTSKFSFVSTGGTAMLELLGGRTLPGVKALG